MSRQLQDLTDQDRLDETLDELDLKEAHHIDGGMFQLGPFGVLSGATDQQLPLVDQVDSGEGIRHSISTASSSLQLRNSLQTSPTCNTTSHTENNVSPPTTHNPLTLLPPTQIHVQLHLDVDHPLSQHTSFLLEYYKSQLGTLFSPLRVRHSPWGLLHFPCALSTLSELSICKTATHSKTSLLFSILAVSAFNLDRILQGQMNTSNYWFTVGDGLRQQAQMQLCKTAETEMGNQRGRYLHILMAMLKMVTISVRHTP
jgi:hypothetical protein